MAVVLTSNATDVRQTSCPSLTLTVLFVLAGAHTEPIHTEQLADAEPVIPREHAADQIPVDMFTSSSEMLKPQ